jgi:hypothetical protein
MNSLDLIIALFACGLVFLAMVVGYSVGHKDGHREGYSKGRSISRVREISK